MADEQPDIEERPLLLKKAAAICSSLILGGIVIGLSCARGENAAQEAEPLPSTMRGFVSVPVQKADERLLPGTKSTAPFTTDSLDGVWGPVGAQASLSGAQEPSDLLPSTKVRVFDSSKPIRQVLEDLAAQPSSQPATQPATSPAPAQRP